MTALVAAGVEPCQSQVLAAAAGRAPADVLRQNRRWSEQEWAEATAALAGARLGDRRTVELTPAGRAARREIEEHTDRLALGPYEALGADRCDELLTALQRLAQRVVDGGGVPWPNPIGGAVAAHRRDHLTASAGRRVTRNRCAVRRCRLVKLSAREPLQCRHGLPALSEHPRRPGRLRRRGRRLAGLGRRRPGLAADGGRGAGRRCRGCPRTARPWPTRAPGTARPRCTSSRSTAAPARRLSFWGDPFTKVAGWLPDGRVVASTAVGEPFRSRVWAWALPLDGGVPERLPFGPATVVSTRAGGGTVLGVDQRRAGATWKRYRGGTAAKLWIDPDGSGEFRRLLRELDGQLEDPDWVGDRVVFLSDHEGWANVYSALPDGSDLRRHSDHGESYARALRDRRHPRGLPAAGELWLLDDLDAAAQPRRLEISLGRPADRAAAAAGAGPRLARRHGRGPHRAGQRGRGARHRALADQPGRPGAGAGRPAGRAGPAAAGARAGARRRGGGAGGGLGDRRGGRRRARGRPGGRQRARRGGWPPGSSAGCSSWRPRRTARSLAVATHDGRVLVVDVAGGEVREVARTEHDDASGLDLLARLGLAGLVPPRRGGAGRRSARRGWPTGPRRRPWRSPRCGSGTPARPSPWTGSTWRSCPPGPSTRSTTSTSSTCPSRARPGPTWCRWPRPRRRRSARSRAGGPPGRAGRPGRSTATGEDAPPQPVILDAEAIEQRVIAVPVATAAGPRAAGGARRAGLAGGPAARRCSARTARPPTASRRGPGWSATTSPSGARSPWPTRSTSSGSAATASGCCCGTTKSLRVVPADRRVDPDEESDRDAVVEVDLRRVRVQVDPAAQWRQMYDEAGRLMRDHFWIADMADVDWDGVLERYRPVLDRVATRDDLVRPALGGAGRAGHLARVRDAAAAAGAAGPGARPARRRPGARTGTAGWCAGCCPASPRCAGPARRSAARASRCGPATRSSRSTAGRWTRGRARRRCWSARPASRSS